MAGDETVEGQCLVPMPMVSLGEMEAIISFGEMEAIISSRKCNKGLHGSHCTQVGTSQIHSVTKERVC